MKLEMTVALYDVIKWHFIYQQKITKKKNINETEIM